MKSKNRHIVLLSVMVAVALSASGCGQSNAPLPVAHAPQREEVREVPADGIIRIEAGDTILESPTGMASTRVKLF